MGKYTTFLTCINIIRDDCDDKNNDNNDDDEKIWVAYLLLEEIYVLF